MHYWYLLAGEHDRRLVELDEQGVQKVLREGYMLIPAVDIKILRPKMLIGPYKNKAKAEAAVDRLPAETTTEGDDAA